MTSLVHSDRRKCKSELEKSRFTVSPFFAGLDRTWTFEIGFGLEWSLDCGPLAWTCEYSKFAEKQNAGAVNKKFNGHTKHLHVSE